MLEERRRYLWVDEDYDLAWTVAVVEGSTEDTTVDAYDGRAEPIGRMAFGEAYVPENDLGDYFLIQTLSHGRHVVVIENNGWVGTRRGTARRASVGGRFFSVYWSPSGDRIVQAVDGELTAWFEPLALDDTTNDGNLYPDWLSDVVFSTDGLHSTMLAVLERQTGLAFDRNWLNEKLPTYRIPGHYTLE